MKLRKIFSLLMFFIAVGLQGQDLRIHVDKKGRVGFADSQGNVVIDCKYESATPFSDGVSVVSKSDKYGLINDKGEVILPLKYSSISTWNNLRLLKDGKKMGLADKRGNIVLKVEYSLISKSNCYGKALIAIGGKSTANEKKTYMNGAKYGIIDANGSVLIPAQYKGLYEFAYDGKLSHPFDEGQRLLYSYHNISDTLITDCSYLGASKNGASIYEAGVIDGSGKSIIKEGLYSYVMYPKSNMVRYYIAKKKETICGYHNILTGTSFQAATFKLPLANVKFWTHGDFIGEIAPVNGNQWSFIDKNGKSIRSGYTALKHSETTGLWGAKNSSDTWDVFDDNNTNLERLSGYNEIEFPKQQGDKEVFVVKKGNNYGGISRSGSVVIPFEYEHALANSYDVVPVKKSGKWGALTADNRELFPPMYANFIMPDERNSQHYWVQQSDSLFYHLNLSNNKVSPNGFKTVHNFKNGVAFVIPEGFAASDNIVNKAQLYAPNTPYSTIYGQKKEADAKNKRGKANDKKQESNEVVPSKSEKFGLLINTDDALLLTRPVSVLYKDRVVEELKNRVNKPLTEAEAKSVLLKVTQENRVYGLNELLDEDEWNY